jgi:L-histidine N-alpha-methyltransferase
VPRAHYDPATRVVVGLLHVVEDHEARIGALDVELRLRAGNAINVGFSAKFDRGELEAEAREHGLLLEADWTDPEWHYGLFLARRI